MKYYEVWMYGAVVGSVQARSPEEARVKARALYGSEAAIEWT